MEAKVPGNVLVYTRRRMSAFFHSVAERTFDGAISYCSDWPGLEPINFMDSFYRCYRAASEFDEFDENQRSEIIARCRLLRRLPRTQAVAMVHAMGAALVELIERARPQYLLTLEVDNYVSDVLYRLCSSRGVRIIMLGGGVIKNTILLTAYGEYHKVREPSNEEVGLAIASLMDNEGRVTYGRDFNGYSFREHMANVGVWWARCLLFTSFRVLGHSPLNFRYLVESARNGQGHRSLWNYPAASYFESDWQQRIARTTRPSVFIPLAYSPEASTDYWLQDLRFIKYENFANDLCRYLSKAYQVVVKEHWAMLGRRPVSFYKRLGSIPGVVMVPPAVNSRRVMDLVERVVVGSGTPGIEAALRGKRVVTLCVPYYYVQGHYLAISSADAIEALPRQLEQFTPPAISSEIRQRLARRLLEPTIPGNILPTRFLDSVENCELTSQGLRAYLADTAGTV